MAERVRTRRLSTSADEATYAVCGFGATSPMGVWPLEGTMTVGRLGSGADIELPCGLVSTQHGKLSVVGGEVCYQDLGSANGTYLKGARVEGVVRLGDGDALEFAPASAPSAAAFRLVVLRGVGTGFAWRRVPFGPDVQEVVCGRGSTADGDVSLSDAYVSQRHASFFRSSKGLYVLDLMSTNGVWLDGVRVEGNARVHAGSIVRLGTSVVYVGAGELWIGEATDVQKAPVAGEPTVPPAARPAGAGESVPEPAVERPRATSPTSRDALVIDIEQKDVWTRVSRKTILRDVHVSVEPGDMVLILGGSGAGKTTFLNAVMGYDKAEGTIRLGDVDVYEEYERIKYQIGYVPQQDLVRMNDSVRETLLAAARLRMPARSTDAEYEERVRWASELLGLRREGDTLVGRLSGGQRKRLSIAVELVGDPALFFLDEPDSGLDGIMARSLLLNLRDIADLGKMVLVITHGPDRGADLFSKVLVLAKSDDDGAGHLVFFGAVDEAKAFFGVGSLEDIVRRINRPDEGGEGRADEYMRKWEAM